MSIADKVLYVVTHPRMRNEALGMTLPSGAQIRVLIDGDGKVRQYREDDGVTVADPRVDEDIAEHLAKVGFAHTVWTGTVTPDLFFLDPLTGQVVGRGAPASQAQADLDALKLQVAELLQRVRALETDLGRHFGDHAQITHVGPLAESFTHGGTGQPDSGVVITTPPAPLPKPKAKSKREQAAEDDDAEASAPNAEALKALGQG